MEEIIRQIAVGLAGGIGLLVGSMVLIAFLRRFLIICKPNEIIVFAGRQRRLADGTTVGYTILQHGRRVRIPLLETAQSIDMSTMTVDMQISNAYSRGNIPLSVHAIANVKICRRPGVIDNAAERFLGRSREEIRRVAKETIEGSLRGVVAKLTPEQVNEDRLSFTTALAEEAEEDLLKIGLQIDTLKIQSVTDAVGYLDSIGRARIADVLRDAEVAESNNKREADRLIAEAQGRARVAQENAASSIQSRNNELRRYTAELNALARAEEERTAAASAEARARAEVELQEVRTELAQLQLQADEVLPAQVGREASRLLAEGQAAAIAATGAATAEALRLLAESWSRAGRNAEDIFLLQQIEPLLRRIVERVGQVGIKNVNLIDGGDGAALGRLAASYPEMIASVLESISATTGIDIRGVLRRGGGGSGEDGTRPPRAREAAASTRASAPAASAAVPARPGAPSGSAAAVRPSSPAAVAPAEVPAVATQKLQALGARPESGADAVPETVPAARPAFGSRSSGQ